MEKLIKFFRELIKEIAPVVNKYNLYLGGGTALMLKYKHRESYDLDFFAFEPVDLDKILREIAFSLSSKYDFAIKYPTLEISNREFTTKIEVHKRIGVKLLGYEDLLGIKKLSDLDILLEKIYFIERGKEEDLTDIKLLLKKLNINWEEIIKKLVEKFGISKSYAEYLVKVTKERLGLDE